MIDVKHAVIDLHNLPQEEAADIGRCLATLYSVWEGEQPLDREFGINYSFLDQPENIARNVLALEIIEKTARYEPRAAVEKVEYETGAEGQLVPVIRLKRGEA